VGRARLEKEVQGKKRAKTGDKTHLSPHARMQQGRALYSRAADLLLSAGFLEDAFACLWSAQRFADAGMLCVYSGRWPDAAMAFNKADRPSLAAAALAHSGDLAGATLVLSRKITSQQQVASLLAFVAEHIGPAVMAQDQALRQVVESAVGLATAWYVCAQDPEGIIRCVRGHQEYHNSYYGLYDHHYHPPSQ
jgi:hypothetical protein